MKIIPRRLISVAALLCLLLSIFSAQALSANLGLCFLAYSLLLFILVALRKTGLDRFRGFTPIFVGAFLMRLIVTLVLYAVSYFHLPLFQGIQLGDGFWTFGLDSITYDRWAPRILDAIHWGLPVPDMHVAPDFYFYVAGIYWLFAHNPLFVTFLNCGLMVIGTILLVHLFFTLHSSPLKPWIIAVIAFWPSSLIWSSQVLKESISFFLIAIVLAGLAYLLSAVTIPSRMLAGCILLIELIFLARVRYYLGPILLASALLATLLFLRRNAERLRHLAGLGLFCLCVVLAMLVRPYLNPLKLSQPAHPELGYVRKGEHLQSRGDFKSARILFEKALRIRPGMSEALLRLNQINGTSPSHLDGATEDKQVFPGTPGTRTSGEMPAGAGFSLNSLKAAVNSLIQELSFRNLRRLREGFIRSGGHSVVSADVKLTHTTQFFKFLPRALTNALLAPYPWQILDYAGPTGLFKSFSIVDSIIIFLLFPAAVVGLWRARQQAPLVLIFLFCLLGLSALGLVLTNLGTLIRLRLQFILPLLMFAGAAPEWVALRKLWRGGTERKAFERSA